MAFYECVMLARQDLSTKQVEDIRTKIGSFIKETGGKVEKEEYWGLRDLAYLIKKSPKAHYILFNFDCTKETIKELDRRLGLNEDVLRQLILRIDEIEEGPSVMMRTATEEE